MIPGKILELLIIQIGLKLLVKNMIMKRAYHVKKKQKLCKCYELGLFTSVRHLIKVLKMCWINVG